MIQIGELVSRSIRVNFLDNFDPDDLTAVVKDAVDKNIRTIPDTNNFPEGESEADSNILSIIFNWGTTLAKWSFKALKWLGISMSEAWGWLVATWTTLSNFNWNASDEQLKTSIENYNIQMSGIWGGIFGKFGIGYLGTIALGAGIGMIFPYIGGPNLARLLVSSVNTELLPDLVDDLGSAITQTANIWASIGLLNVYMFTRKWIKKIPKSTLDGIIGDTNADWIRNAWGEPNAPTLTFSGTIEDKIEDIDSKQLQAFTEEAIEEGWDTFVEGGAIIAQKLDEVLFMYEAAIQNVNGPDRSIIIYPDENSNEEFLILEDIPQEQLIATTQTLINQHRIIGDRSVGNIVATSLDEPQISRPLLRKLTILFSSRPKPPWVDVSEEANESPKPAKTFAVSIPDIKKGTTWKEIKKAAKAYSWGSFRAVARFSNKRKMVVHGSTKQIALDKLNEFLDLSDAKVQSIMVTEEEDVPLKAKKKPTMIYPKSAKLLHRKNSLDNDGNVVINNTYFDTEIIEFLLWVEDEPPYVPVID